MRVIVDFNNGGHHASFLSSLARAGCAGPFVVSPPLFDELPDDVRALARFDVIDAPPRDPRAQAEALLRYIDEHPEVDGVFHLAFEEILPGLVRHAHEIARNRRRQISGIWIASNFFYKRREGLAGRIKFMVFLVAAVGYLCVARGGELFFLNEDIARHLRRRLPSFLRGRVHRCPDPVDSNILAVGRLPPPQGAVPTVLLFGKHTPRKGTFWALDAIFRGWSRPLRVLVAGDTTPDPRLAPLKSRTHENVTVEWWDRRLSEEEVLEAFTASDVVLAPYQRFGGSSGIVNSAVASGRPVLAPDWGIVASRVKEMNLGLTFRPDDEADFLRSLSILIDARPWERNEEKVAEYLGYHNSRNLHRVISGVHPDD